MYIETTPVDQGDATGLGSTVRLYTKGWLPYHLRWVARTVAVDLPHGYTLQPPLRRLSILARPLVAANGARHVAAGLLAAALVVVVVRRARS